MREIFVNQDYTRVGFYKSVLDEAGIPNFIRNQYSQFITEMPSHLLFPVLCVVQDEDYNSAIEILGAIHYAQPSHKPDWHCAECREEVPGSFDLCWNCGTPAADADF